MHMKETETILKVVTDLRAGFVQAPRIPNP